MDTLPIFFAYLLFVVFGLVFIWAVGWGLALSFPRLQKLILRIAYGYLTLVIPLLFFAVYEVSYFPPFTKSSHIIAAGETAQGNFMIVGMSDGIPDWWVYLYSKRRGLPWAIYYLDGDTQYWANATMIDAGDHLLLKFPDGSQATKANLNLKTFLMRRNGTDESAIELIPNADPFTSQGRIDRPDKEWPAELWPGYRGQVIPDSR